MSVRGLEDFEPLAIIADGLDLRGWGGVEQRMGQSTGRMWCDKSEGGVTRPRGRVCLQVARGFL